MELQKALKIANYLCKGLAPYCERIAIAGSVRRGKADVKDIELLAIPKRETRGEPIQDLFGNVTAPALQVNMLCEGLKRVPKIRWIKPGTSEIIDWPLKNEAKYFRGYIDSCDIKVDIFTARECTWGYQMAIRTGPAEFSQALVQKWLRLGYQGQGGMLTKYGKLVPVREEKDLFDLLYMEYVLPHKRESQLILR
ncbi:hypothetical protein [Rufibacter quisquiliarum]|uniref:DNA polymerase/3'-5' exonuclease PolX n=1 Tax=Rufibacter quisquiliarum TaxID=1549639 RepID=A0A839GH27_9BACT|nr:hypothetical protein [Rufibacter quisquiliarum]MBA9078964.1 DNA polymerase/3'-5' exonuclease PolX [Rufibacter quisquiliarum]